MRLIQSFARKNRELKLRNPIFKKPIPLKIWILNLKQEERELEKRLRMRESVRQPSLEIRVRKKSWEDAFSPFKTFKFDLKN